MANRILTPQQISELCNKVGPGFAVLAPSDICPGSPFPVVMLHHLSREVRTLESILPDDEFIAAVPQKMWNEFHAPVNAWRVPRPEDVRGETHGDYTHMSIVIQNIKDAMRSGEAWGRCTASQREALELTATKIGRIVCGDPNHVDHWDDIIGYANLAKNRIAREHV